MLIDRHDLHLRLLPLPLFYERYPVESVEMMRCIIDEAESWKGSNPELVLPDAAEPQATSEMEGIASATVHAADSLSESVAFSVSAPKSVCWPRVSIYAHRARAYRSFRPMELRCCCGREAAFLLGSRARVHVAGGCACFLRTPIRELTLSHWPVQGSSCCCPSLCQNSRSCWRLAAKK